ADIAEHLVIHAPERVDGGIVRGDEGGHVLDGEATVEPDLQEPGLAHDVDLPPRRDDEIGTAHAVSRPLGAQRAVSSAMNALALRVRRRVGSAGRIAASAGATSGGVGPSGARSTARRAYIFTATRAVCGPRNAAIPASSSAPMRLWITPRPSSR